MKRNKFNRRIYDAFAIVLLILVVISWIWALHKDKPQIVGYDYITGTSLWDLARDCPNDMDKRDYIAEIVVLNAVSGNVVYADRLYQVPVYKEH